MSRGAVLVFEASDAEAGLRSIELTPRPRGQVLLLAPWLLVRPLGRLLDQVLGTGGDVQNEQSELELGRHPLQPSAWDTGWREHAETQRVWF